MSETEICMVTLFYPPAYSGQGRQRAILSAGLAVVADTGHAGDLTAELTVCEAKLLAYMMQYPHDVLSCRELVRAALGYDVTEREKPRGSSVLASPACGRRSSPTRLALV